MGRAKGTKNDHASQPAPGRGVRPKILEELQEIGGMSPAWHRRNHLVQEALGEGVSSAGFPWIQEKELGSLRTDPWGPGQIWRLGEKAQWDQVQRGDPVLRAIFENEWMRLQNILRYAEMINRQIVLDKEKLWLEWQDMAISSFREAERTGHASAIQFSLLYMISFDTYPEGGPSSIPRKYQIQLAEVLRTFAGSGRDNFPTIQEDLQAAVRRFGANSVLLDTPSMPLTSWFASFCQEAWAPGTDTGLITRTKEVLSRGGISMDNQEVDAEFQTAFIAALAEKTFPPQSRTPEENEELVLVALARATQAVVRHALWKAGQQEGDLAQGRALEEFLCGLDHSEKFKELIKQYNVSEYMKLTFYQDARKAISSQLPWSSVDSWKALVSGERSVGDLLLETLQPLTD